MEATSSSEMSVMYLMINTASYPMNVHLHQ
jgi:hypothetical protein